MQKYLKQKTRLKKLLKKLNTLGFLIGMKSKQLRLKNSKHKKVKVKYLNHKLYILLSFATFILSKKHPFKVIKYWCSNNQQGNVTINVPKDYVKIHNLLVNKFVVVTCRPDGILLQPLKEVEKTE